MSRCLEVLKRAQVPANKNQKLPQTFFPQKFTPEYIFSKLSSLHKDTEIKNRVCSITTCLFHLEKNAENGIQLITSFTQGTRTVVLFENMYFCCTYLTKTKILSMQGTGYFLK